MIAKSILIGILDHDDVDRRERYIEELKAADLDKLTERMISELGLTACADTIVGGALIKGISGGERKRTSVGVELVGPFS